MTIFDTFVLRSRSFEQLLLLFIVTLDLIGITEQLRYSEARLHIVGSSSFVKGSMVHVSDIHLSLCKQDSIIEKFPLLKMVID